MPAEVASPSASEDCAGVESKEQSENAEERMWRALKRHIARERQRKKEEYEAEVEEERLRKEREARQRQDVMTLEETKEQIDQLEQKMKKLGKEKQQLLMQLKKVLNEEEIRKRRQAKENSEMAPMKMQVGNVNNPMFLPKTSQGQEAQLSQVRPPPLTAYTFNKSNVRSVGGGVKRARSPSTGPYQPHNMYQHHVHDQSPLKHQPVYSDHAPPQHKRVDGRIGRTMGRAVLWNKPTQYSVAPSVGYYEHPAAADGGGERPPPPLYAPGPHAAGPHAQRGLVYGRPQLYLNVGPRDDNDVPPQVLIGLSEPQHTSGGGGGGGGGGAAAVGAAAYAPRHLNIHPNMVMHNSVQGAQPGSITQGYPVRAGNTGMQTHSMYPARHRY